MLQAGADCGKAAWNMWAGWIDEWTDRGKEGGDMRLYVCLNFILNAVVDQW